VVLAFDLHDKAGAEAKLAELRRLAPNNPDVERLASEVQRRSGAS
jgi:predicted Zn-dependent protease